MSFEKYLQESSLSRIYSAYKEHDSGTITAFRSAQKCGEGEAYSLKDNKQRNSLLKNKLLAKGYGITAIKGTYTENFGTDKAQDVVEDSFFVVDLQDKGTLEKDLILLGNAFDQDSITFSQKDGTYYLIGTNSKCPNAYPSYRKKVKLEKPFFGANAEFHSKINNRPFIFERPKKDEIKTLTDFTPTEIRSIKESANTILNFGDYLDSKIQEETSSGDIASVPSALGVAKRIYPTDKVKKKKKLHYHANW